MECLFEGMIISFNLMSESNHPNGSHTCTPLDFVFFSLFFQKIFLKIFTIY
jgi:hypothetical protein